MQTLIDGALLSWMEMKLGPFRGYAFRGEGGEVVLVDPPDPGRDLDALEALGKPSHVLVTFRDHDRAVAKLADRFGAKVWVPKGTGGSIPRIDVEYDEATALPAGLKAISMPAVGYGEHALVGHAAGRTVLFIGDALIHAEGPGWLVGLVLRRKGPFWVKKSYRGGNTAEALKQIQILRQVTPDVLAFSHGSAVTRDAATQLSACLDEVARGS